MNWLDSTDEMPFDLIKLSTKPTYLYIGTVERNERMGGFSMKKKIELVKKGMICTALAAGVSLVGTSVPSYASETTDEPQITYAPAIGDVVYVPVDPDQPDKAEIEANKKLKEVMDQWDASGEYPDYFTQCKFYGERAMYPVIQLTDISEETRQAFYEATGVKHEKWLFVEVKYSKNQLLEFERQIEAEYGNDERIYDICVDANGVYGGSYTELLSDGRVLEWRPKVDDVYNWPVMVIANEDIDQLKEELYAKYGEDKVAVLCMAENLLLQVEAEPPRKKGEITEEGKITLKDAQKALQAALGINKLYGVEFQAADIFGTGKIDLKNAQIILRAALGIETMEEAILSEDVETFIDNYVSIELTTDKKSYVQGEEIELTIHTKNLSNLPLHTYGITSSFGKSSCISTCLKKGDGTVVTTDSSPEQPINDEIYNGVLAGGEELETKRTIKIPENLIEDAVSMLGEIEVCLEYTDNDKKDSSKKYQKSFPIEILIAE